MAALGALDPPVAVGVIDPDIIALHPQTLQAGEDEFVLELNAARPVGRTSAS
ncbi:MAG TPA: hypothetical protein VE287_08745 [Actinopolymorphaceae bacterium]|nr:hypothetical protein [Actinopolymorphaceae bacterium]